MSTSLRLGWANGLLLASYFVPAWGMVAYRIVLSPIYGFYERPNISVALFISDHLHLNVGSAVRVAWLLAFSKLLVVTFLLVFLVTLASRSPRVKEGCDEALGWALGLGATISFASMIMASRVGEGAAMHLHAAELLLMLGGIVVMLVEPPKPAVANPGIQLLASSSSS